MALNNLQEEIKNNKEILLLQLKQKDCPICNDFKKIIDKTKLKHLGKLKVIECELQDFEEVNVFPHPIYPMNFFYVSGQEYPFIRAGACTEEQLDNEISKFSRVLKGETINEVFN